MRKMVGLVMAVCLLRCGSGSTDRTSAACARIWDASCAKLAECRVVISGVLVTSQICAGGRSDAIPSCVMEEGAGIAGATDAQIDACVQGFMTFMCSDLCNQVPMD